MTELSDKLQEDFVQAWGFRAETRSRTEQDSAQMWFNRGVSALFKHLETVSDSELEAALEAFVGGPFDFPESRPYWEPKMRAAIRAAREAL